MRIAVDVMGGDHGCAVVVGGVALALANQPALSEIILVGQASEIEAGLKHARCHDKRVRVIHASEVMTMKDKPLDAVRRKKDCSMVRAMELVRDGKAEAIISPGNTGGLVAAATFKLRRLDRVERPAIATIMPSANGEFLLLDAGANHECKPVHLLQFALMGNVYSREILGRKTPRVGILSNGTEETKGNELTRESAKLCRQADINFIGYVEGHDLFTDKIDVVVTDGFVGNIVLKSVESIAHAILRTVKEELTASRVRQIGAILARGAFRKVKQRMDPDAYGGAPLLGLNGTVIKAHGSAKERAIMNAIRVAGETIQHRINETMANEIRKADERLGLSKNAVHASADADP